MPDKRSAGQKKGKAWLVLTESTGQPGVGWKHSCGSTVMGADVARPVWDGPEMCSGAGSCQYETIPYCPKCEEKPNFHGSPITG